MDKPPSAKNHITVDRLISEDLLTSLNCPQFHIGAHKFQFYKHKLFYDLKRKIKILYFHQQFTPDQ